MSKGFITLGVNTDLDKIKYCYTLAMSIKLSDPDAEVCLVVDKDQIDNVPDEYANMFDYITELPFGNTGYADGFHGSSIWQLIHCSPFEENIYLDSDTLFLNVDVELLWEQFKSYDIAMPVFARTYRNQLCNKIQDFEFEINYELPLLYNQLIYFKRSSTLALEWFKMADPCFQNWRQLYDSSFSEMKPTTFNKNIICNLVTKLVDCETEARVILNNFYDISTTSQYLWSNDVPENWTELFNSWFNINHGLLIENSKISSGIIHYRDEGFITQDLINDITDEFNTRNQRTQAA